MTPALSYAHGERGVYVIDPDTNVAIAGPFKSAQAAIDEVCELEKVGVFEFAHLRLAAISPPQLEVVKGRADG